MELGTYIDVITNGIELAGGFLVEPIGSDLIEYLIHFRSNNAKKDLSLSFVQIKRRERKKQTQT